MFFVISYSACEMNIHKITEVPNMECKSLEKLFIINMPEI